MTTSLLDKHFKQLKSQLDALNAMFINQLNQVISNNFSILNSIHSNLVSEAGMISGLKEGKERDGRIVKFHTQNLELLKNQYTSISSESFLNGSLEEFSAELERYLDDLPENLSVEYPLVSFKASKEDPFTLKVRLAVTRLSHRFSKRKVEHAERRIARVHYKKLVKGFLLPLYLHEIGKQVKESQNKLIESYLTLFEIESLFLQNNYSIQPEELSKIKLDSNELKAVSPDTFFDEHKTALETYLLRSGLALSMNLWQTMGRSLDYNMSREGLAKASRSWQSTLFAIFEDWRLREQLYTYIHQVQLERLNVEAIYSKRFISSLFPEVEKQLAHTSRLMQRLPDPDTSDMEAIRTFLVSELYKLKKDTINEEQKAQLLQTTEDIPKLLQKLENEVSEHLDVFQDKVGVVSNPKYKNGIKPSEIYYFSPGEFIEFECLNGLGSRLEEHRSNLGKELLLILNEFNEYDQIIDFYLDSTISLTEKSGMAEAEVIIFFRDGLQRLLNISNRIADLLKELNTAKLSEISALMKEYLDQVAELDDNDNIINIYSRLLKSKALAESRSKREKLSDYARKTWSKGSHFLSKHSTWLQSSYSDIKKRLRLDSSPEPISSHISNYLTDILKRIYKLPLIYQYLFENIPIREFNLFLSRENEIGQLNTAYEDWLKENFAATLIQGENGAGKSSLLNYYSLTLKTNYKIHVLQASEFYYTEDDFYRLIRKIFGNDKLTDDASISDHLSSFTERRIIIVDGMERLFIRKVNGFLCLQKLLSLIVSSNHQIFWICSVSKYASVYLNKTMGLSEYFDYIIDIDTLSSAQIRDIVLKRNRLSGYELRYLPEVSAEDSPRSKNLTHSELEDRFFDELNQFAGSNISLSLNYWLQSIHSLEEDHIEIGHFLVPDFSFLDSISPEKAYTLLVVLMHGKITLEQHALIFSQRVDKSYRVLSILKEDSILVKQDAYYTLNGILFRHVVKMLKNRNLIH